MRQSEWVCPSCGFKNRPANQICGGTGPMGCKAPRPSDAGQPGTQQFGGQGPPYGGQPFGAQPFGGVQPYGGGQQYGGPPFGGQPFSGQPFGGHPFHGQPAAPQPFGPTQLPGGWRPPQQLPFGGPGAGALVRGPAAPQQEWWTCDCGFRNRGGNQECGGTGPMGCKAPRPKAVLPGAADADSADGEGEVPPREPGTLRVVTFNVSSRNVEEARVNEVARILRQCDADVIAVQELSSRFIQLLVADECMAKYKVLLQDPRIHYYTALFIHPDVDINGSGCMPFEVTTQTRALQFADLSFPGFGDACVATCHLEVPRPREPGTSARQAQLGQAAAALNDRALEGQGVVWLGDFSWIKTDGDLQLPEEWADVWPELRGPERGPTYHANQGGACASPARMDRVLVHGLEGVRIMRLGMKVLEGSGPRRYASDHYAVLAVLRRA